MSTHNHTCHCGADVVYGPHSTGDLKCFREMCAAPERLQNDFWRVEGHEITGYSLREQRLYHQHSCGCWSRAKEGSTEK